MHDSVLERAAIEEDGGASDTVGGGVLIHHAATNADIVVLRTLAQHGEAAAVQDRREAAGHGPGARKLQSCRGSQARPNRNGAGEHATESLQPAAVRAEGPGD